jgi:hypothetical protein
MKWLYNLAVRYAIYAGVAFGVLFWVVTALAAWPS